VVLVVLCDVGLDGRRDREVVGEGDTQALCMCGVWHGEGQGSGVPGCMFVCCIQWRWPGHALAASRMGRIVFRIKIGGHFVIGREIGQWEVGVGKIQPGQTT
jgi:hypothetical protein